MIYHLFLALLAVLLLAMPVSAQQEMRDENNYPSPRAAVNNVHFCGHCTYSYITTVFDGYLTTPGRIVKQEKKLVNIGYDPWLNSFTNPFVIYRYTDSYGNIFVPFENEVYSPSDLQRVEGNLGSCPSGFFWE